MKRLALDTSSTSCTVALQVGDEVIGRYEEQEREHTRLLIPMIKDVLQEAELSIGELDAIVLGNGPGSFFGMRIAASVAQGLAHGAGIGIIAVSSLAAMAAQVFAETDAERVAVAQDAHMSEVYLGLFERREDGLPKPFTQERLQEQAVISEMLSYGEWRTAGFGWQRYPELGAINEASIGASSNTFYPDARYLLRLAVGEAEISPRDIKPAYLRQKVAEKPAGSGR